MTTTRSREDVKGFHNVTFDPGGKAVSFFPVCGPFFKRAREREVKLRHVVYEV